jgi:hypothetical protein
VSQPRPWLVPLGRALIIALAVLPVLAAFYMMCTHWVPVPYWDEWDSPGKQLAAYYRGNLSFADLFSQHNESRSFFPRLVYLALYLTAGWDVRCGMAATFVLACAGSAGLYAVARRTNPSQGAVLLMFAVMNFLLFSPRQYENFLYAIMGEVFTPPCALILAILVNLSNLSLKWKALVNAALAVISTYTFANGMLLWVLAFPLGITSVLRPEEARFRNFWRMAYASIGVLSIFCYFTSYHHPPLSPPFVSPLERLPALLHFFLYWIGSLFRVGDPALCGAIVVLLFGGLAAVAISQGRRTGEWRAHYPWLILGCYPLISGGIVAMGRLGFGYFMAGDVRYTVSTAFCYIAVVGLGFSVCAQAKRRPLKSGIAFSAAIGFLVILVSLWAITFKKERRFLPILTAVRQHSLLVLRWSEAIPQNPEIALLSPYPLADVVAITRILAEHDALRPRVVSQKLAAAVSARPDTAGASAGTLEAAKFEAGELSFHGWARVPDQDRPADCVVLGFEVDGEWKPFCVVETGGNRPDAPQLGSAALKRAGFSGDVRLANFPRGETILKAWAIDLQNERTFPLSGEASVQNR